jgi:hypothetical protein
VEEAEEHLATAEYFLCRQLAEAEDLVGLVEEAAVVDLEDLVVEVLAVEELAVIGSFLIADFQIFSKIALVLQNIYTTSKFISHHRFIGYNKQTACCFTPRVS